MGKEEKFSPNRKQIARNNRRKAILEDRERLLQLTDDRLAGYEFVRLPLAKRESVTAALERFHEHGNLTKYTKEAGISYTTHALMMERDPEYRAMVALSTQMAVAEVESSLYLRARESSDEAARLWLKGNCPERYHEKSNPIAGGDVQINVVFEGGPPCQTPSRDVVDQGQ